MDKFCESYFLLAILSLLVSCTNVLAWGPGHDDQTRAILEHLPVSLTEHWDDATQKQIIKHDSHYPDTFKSFELQDVGSEAMVYLASHKIKNRYGLHSDTGRAVSFILLARALRQKQYRQAGLWIAVLGHSTGDMVAANHDTLIHMATYSWARWPINLPQGKPIKAIVPLLDLAWTARHKDGGRIIFDKQVADHLLPIPNINVQQQLVDIMMYGYHGAAYCASRGVPMLNAAVQWIDTQDTTARQKLWRITSELGTWAAVRTIKDVKLAMTLAESDQSIELTPQCINAYKSQRDAWMIKRDLKDDALYADILSPIPAVTSNQAVTGIVLEPAWKMNESALGYGAHVVSSAIARTLKNSSTPYATIDLRALMLQAPNPQQVHTLIVVAASPANYVTVHRKTIEKNLTHYLQAGGKIIWIRGRHGMPTFASSLTQSLLTMPKGQRWPLPQEELIGTTFLLNKQSLGTWMRDPKPAYAWHTPYCADVYDDADADYTPLLQLQPTTANAKPLTVGITFPRNHPRVALVPIYAFFPGITDTSVLQFSGSITLDPTAHSLLNTCLNQLRTGSKFISENHK